MDRVLHKLHLQLKPIKKTYRPKPYEQMTFPGEGVQINVKIVPSACEAGQAADERLVQYTAIDEYPRFRFLKAHNEHSTHSSKDFLLSLGKAWSRKHINIQCIQTDNGFEFTNRLNSFQTQSKTAFELTAELLGIRIKHIRPYTPRHNGKVERSHLEDQKRFYSRHSFYSLNDFPRQRAAWETRSNQLPMQPLGFLSPIEFLKQYTIQHV